MCKMQVVCKLLLELPGAVHFSSGENSHLIWVKCFTLQRYLQCLHFATLCMLWTVIHIFSNKTQKAPARHVSPPHKMVKEIKNKYQKYGRKTAKESVVQTWFAQLHALIFIMQHC